MIYGDFKFTSYHDYYTRYSGAAVTRYTGGDEVVSVPANLGEMEVIAISTNGTYDSTGAFEFNNTIKKVILPETVRVIGKMAFSSCENLVDFVSSRNLLVINDFAFANCKNLEYIALPDCVMKIDNTAFFGCEKLNNFVFPERSLVIDLSIFEACPSLTHITISDSARCVIFPGIRDTYGQKETIYGNLKAINYNGEVYDDMYEVEELINSKQKLRV